VLQSTFPGLRQTTRPFRRTQFRPPNQVLKKRAATSRIAAREIGMAGALNPLHPTVYRSGITQRRQTMRNFFFTVTLGISGLLPFAVIASAFGF
jgi:hypothetical protein